MTRRYEHPSRTDRIAFWIVVAGIAAVALMPLFVWASK